MDILKKLLSFFYKLFITSIERKYEKEVQEKLEEQREEDKEEFEKIKKGMDTLSEADVDRLNSELFDRVRESNSKHSPRNGSDSK
jgi:protoporphyrinogen oxidase|tara:strand:+ start:276 stop:530 length:255 start_codon:yes stop_codon:yes gene_type:complete